MTLFFLLGFICYLFPELHVLLTFFILFTGFKLLSSITELASNGLVQMLVSVFVFKPDSNIIMNELFWQLRRFLLSGG